MKFTNKQGGSTWLRVVLIIVIVVIVAMSIQGFVLMKNGQTQTHQDQSAVNSPTPASPVTTDLYSYTLPSGWQNIPNTTVQGIQQAMNKNGDNFSIITNALPATLAKAKSITQIVTVKDIGKVAQSNFSGATVDNTTTGKLNGQDAYVITLNRTVSMPNGGSVAQSILQYSAIYNGTTYSLIFMSATSRQTLAQADFESIINSFNFK